MADVPVITQLEFQQFMSYDNLEGGASDPAHRRSGGHSSCFAETGTHSAYFDAPSAALGGC